MNNLIIDINEKQLALLCVDLLSKTYLELNQKISPNDTATLANVLATDLKLDFKNLYFTDIENAFRHGVRQTDEFHLNVKTMYKWIKKWRQIIWDATYAVEVQNGKPTDFIAYRQKPKALCGQGIGKIGTKKTDEG